MICRTKFYSWKCDNLWEKKLRLKCFFCDTCDSHFPSRSLFHKVLLFCLRSCEISKHVKRMRMKNVSECDNIMLGRLWRRNCRCDNDIDHGWYQGTRRWRNLCLFDRWNEISANLYFPFNEWLVEDECAAVLPMRSDIKILIAAPAGAWDRNMELTLPPPTPVHTYSWPPGHNSDLSDICEYTNCGISVVSSKQSIQAN